MSKAAFDKIAAGLTDAILISRGKGAPVRRRHPEQALQRAICRMLAYTLRSPAWFTAFPAGGGGLVRGKILVGMGLKPGVPDILIVAAGRAYWLELKSRLGRLSNHQTATIAALEAASSETAVGRELDEAHRRAAPEPCVAYSRGVPWTAPPAAAPARPSSPCLPLSLRHRRHRRRPQPGRRGVDGAQAPRHHTQLAR